MRSLKVLFIVGRFYAEVADLRIEIKAICIGLLVMFTAVALSGCLLSSADELYSLPQVSEEYLRLQWHINTVLNQGAVLSPPSGGPNRQSVQLRDFDGDGINEVFAFFSIPDDSPLKVYIFKMIDGDYAVTEIIEGVGTGFESVRYVDMDGDGCMEIIIGWQMGAALKHMSIYSIKDFHSIMLGSAEYEGITVYDLNGDGSDDIITVRLPSQESGAVAEAFSLTPDVEIVSKEARLSNGIETITRVLTGRLIDGVPAIFVESEGKFDQGDLVTDICVYKDGSFSNISVKGPSGVSEETVRATVRFRILSSDINKDGIIKVPMPRLLRAQSERAYYAIDWYSFNSRGFSRLALTTYHNNSDEWFLILPYDWRGKVSVRREDAVTGERTIIFSYIVSEDGPYEDFLKVYRITGDAREERARLPGRVMLISEGMAVFAFELLAPPDSFGLTFSETLIRQNFRLIYSDWLAGTI